MFVSVFQIVLKKWLKNRFTLRFLWKMETITLEYLFAEHARFTILHISSILLALNRSCSLNYFEEIFHSACLLHLAHSAQLVLKAKLKTKRQLFQLD